MGRNDRRGGHRLKIAQGGRDGHWIQLRRHTFGQLELRWHRQSLGCLGTPTAVMDAELAQQHREEARQDNEEAWKLATDPDSRLRDPTRAAELARRAVKLAPEGENWNTLGVAECRAGNWEAARHALRKSMSLRGGGDAADWLSWPSPIGIEAKRAHARKYYGAGRLWTAHCEPSSEESIRFRTEAGTLLGMPEKRPAENADLIHMVEVLAEAGPASAPSFQTRGGIYAFLSQWDRADEDFTKAIEIDKGDPQNWYLRGLVASCQRRQFRIPGIMQRDAEAFHEHDRCPVREHARVDL